LLVVITKDGKVLNFEPNQYDAIRILVGKGDNIERMYCTFSRSEFIMLGIALGILREFETWKVEEEVK
jgi:hypothetical protein